MNLSNAAYFLIGGVLIGVILLVIGIVRSSRKKDVCPICKGTGFTEDLQRDGLSSGCAEPAIRPCVCQQSSKVKQSTA
ncbi:MAG: hypothetical protein NTY04_03130 [Candidatus Staskawiczbacteria bacterium]|nr:hypothetical protein [Candidatus Staskawiczbacteria bacterium]